MSAIVRKKIKTGLFFHIKAFKKQGFLFGCFCFVVNSDLKSCFSSTVSDAIQLQKEWSFAKTCHELTTLYCRVSVGSAPCIGILGRALSQMRMLPASADHTERRNVAATVEAPP